MSERKKSLKGSWLWGALLFTVLVLIDMVTKILADAYFDYGDPYFEIIPGYLEWGLTYNRGVAFSMMTDAPTPAKMALVYSTAVLFVVFAIYYLKLDPRRTWVRVAVTGSLSSGQAAAVAETLAGEDTFVNITDALVLADKALLTRC